MEESTLDQIAGGSDDMAVLQAELADRESGQVPADSRGVQARGALMDRGLALLLVAWTMYAASFYLF
jgi:hypothetical protein